MSELRELIRDSDNYRDILRLFGDVFGVTVLSHGSAHTVRWLEGETYKTQSLERFLMDRRKDAP